MAAENQSTPLEESVEETVEVQESETFADDTVDLDEAKVNELSKSTLGSYVKKASQDAADKAADFGRKDSDQKSVQRSLNRHGMSSADHDAVHKAYKTTDADVRKPEKKAAKRLKGINTAVKKLTKEEEQVDESVYKGMDAFGRGVVAKSRGGKAGEYISKKAKERSDLNKKNDPGMAKKGYALSVTDRDKAMKKAKKRGLNPKYPSQKYGKRKLPEEEVLEQKNCGCGKNPCETYGTVQEKTLTPAEKKKREEVAKAIERDNPKMPMDKKMAIATATAKKVAESSISDRTRALIERAINRKT